MHGAMDPDYVPANDGMDWLYRLDVRLCTDTTLPGQLVEQILAALKQHDSDSLKRIGDVLDRKASSWISRWNSANYSTWCTTCYRTRIKWPPIARSAAKTKRSGAATHNSLVIANNDKVRRMRALCFCNAIAISGN
jgi:hypothetical protein